MIAQPCESPTPNPVLGGWFDGLTTRFGFVEPCAPFGYDIHAVVGQAGVESAHRVTVRVGMAEENFEGAFRVGHVTVIS